MLNQKLPHAPSEEMTIDIDLLYEMDPCELKLDEMIEAEPEPEMIEGLPASDALTPPIVTLSCLNTSSHPNYLLIAKPSLIVRPKWTHWTF
jgi:neutral trehalase